METIWIYQFRLIVIGDSTVGKSCLLHRFTQGRFPGLHSPACDPTVGVDFFSRLLEIEPGKRIKLQLWDTAGQERFRSITRSYYRNSVGGFLVFDITNRRSFEHVKDWLEEAKMHVQPFQIVFLLVGHKCDLASQRQVSREEAERLSTDCGMKYIETSAKDATNVEESFTILTRDIYELIKKERFVFRMDGKGLKVVSFQILCILLRKQSSPEKSASVDFNLLKNYHRQTVPLWIDVNIHSRMMQGVNALKHPDPFHKLVDTTLCLTTYTNRLGSLLS